MVDLAGGKIGTRYISREFKLLKDTPILIVIVGREARSVHSLSDNFTCNRGREMRKKRCKQQPNCGHSDLSCRPGFPSLTPCTSTQIGNISHCFVIATILSFIVIRDLPSESLRRVKASQIYSIARVNKRNT
jgi:hypothetical protein